MPVITTMVIGPRTVLREGIGVTVSRSHFTLAFDVEHVSLIEGTMWASLIRPALAIVLAHDPLTLSTVPAVEALRSRDPSLCIVVLYDAECGKGAEVFRAGANGCLPTTIGPDAFITALDLFMAKELAIASLLVPIASDDLSLPNIPVSAAPRPISLLTGREHVVLQAVALGRSNKHIASNLCLDEATVKSDMRNILRKTGSNNRTQAAVWVHEQKVLRP